MSPSTPIAMNLFLVSKSKYIVKKFKLSYKRENDPLCIPMLSIWKMYYTFEIQYQICFSIEFVT